MHTEIASMPAKTTIILHIVRARKLIAVGLNLVDSFHQPNRVSIGRWAKHCARTCYGAGGNRPTLCIYLHVNLFGTAEKSLLAARYSF